MTDRRPARMRRVLLGVLAALAMLASACGGSSDTTVDSSAQAAPDTGTSADAPAEAALVAATVAGGQIDFGSLEGQDVVLWFWAPW